MLNVTRRTPAYADELRKPIVRQTKARCYPPAVRPASDQRSMSARGDGGWLIWSIPARPSTKYTRPSHSPSRRTGRLSRSRRLGTGTRRSSIKTSRERAIGHASSGRGTAFRVVTVTRAGSDGPAKLHADHASVVQGAEVGGCGTEAQARQQENAEIAALAFAAVFPNVLSEGVLGFQF